MKNKEPDELDNKLEALCHPEHSADDLASALEEINLTVTEEQFDALHDMIRSYMRVVAENVEYLN